MPKLNFGLRRQYWIDVYTHHTPAEIRQAHRWMHRDMQAEYFAQQWRKGRQDAVMIRRAILAGDDERYERMQNVVKLYRDTAPDAPYLKGYESMNRAYFRRELKRVRDERAAKEREAAEAFQRFCAENIAKGLI